MNQNHELKAHLFNCVVGRENIEDWCKYTCLEYTWTPFLRAWVWVAYISIPSITIGTKLFNVALSSV